MRYCLETVSPHRFGVITNGQIVIVCLLIRLEISAGYFSQSKVSCVVTFLIQKPGGKKTTRTQLEPGVLLVCWRRKDIVTQDGKVVIEPMHI